MIRPNELLPLREAVLKQIEGLLGGEEGCHDFDHTLRVLKNARMLATEEACSETECLLIDLAALLHDCARPEEFASRGRICHAERGEKKAEEILRNEMENAVKLSVPLVVDVEVGDTWFNA